MTKVESENVLGGNNEPPMWDNFQGSSYRVTLRYNGRGMAVDFHCGQLAGAPTTVDVLTCLLLDASGIEAAGGSFEEWCSDLGMDDDSISNLKTFKACEAQTNALKELLGDDFDKFYGLDEDELDPLCD